MGQPFDHYMKKLAELQNEVNPEENEEQPDDEESLEASNN